MDTQLNPTINRRGNIIRMTYRGGGGGGGGRREEEGGGRRRW